MVSTKAQVFAKRFAKCPCGEHEWPVEHLFEMGEGREAGPWYCDACGYAWRFRTHGKDLLIDPHLEGGEHRRKTTERLILRIPPGVHSIYVSVNATNYGPSSNHRYFYEEHTCPSNIFREVQQVWLGDELDPHGLFELCEEPPEWTQDLKEGRSLPSRSVKA